MNNPSSRQDRYVVATIKPWNIEAFEKHAYRLPGTWTLITNVEDLTLSRLRQLNPRFIFFPHWSWIVPSEILSEFECVCFHMSDVPYGRGGSPLQNLIALGHEETKLTALRMVEEVDAGPIYMKQNLTLGGSALSIYRRAAEICFRMIESIVANEPTPEEQSGPVVKFRRRTPEESALPATGELKVAYDHIRMLDAPTYPRARLQHGDFLLEFSEAIMLENGHVQANVEISSLKAKVQ